MIRRILSAVILLIGFVLLATLFSSYNWSQILASQNEFMPHGFCLRWDPLLLKTMICANIGIAMAYFAIPLALWYFVRLRKDLPYPWMFRLFGMFIIACGMTHLMKVCTLYRPWYWAEAFVDLYTAVISLITALMLWPLIPKALTLKSPAELEAANRKLEHSILQAQEITNELQAQAELLDLAHDAIMVRDLNGIIRYWNSGAEEVYGYTAAEALGKNYYDLLKTEFSTPKHQMEEELLAEGRWDGELINYRADGQQIFIASRQALKLDSNGVPIAILAISSDITENKRANQRKLALAEMERANSELEQFAYIASHDLQEPLRAVAGCLQILEKTYKNKLDANADELIAHAVAGAFRMRNLINDLLELSRISKEEIDFTPTNLSESLEIALKNLALNINETAAKITYDNLPTVPVNVTQFAQLFQNLINNAIKFRGDKSPEIEVNARHNDKEWLISVHDCGIGFEQEYAERIFQPFKRLHNREHYAGTGIGLAICKKIVERHGGKIWVESEPNKGTTFYFTIPERCPNND